MCALNLQRSPENGSVWETADRFNTPAVIKQQYRAAGLTLPGEALIYFLASIFSSSIMAQSLVNQPYGTRSVPAWEVAAQLGHQMPGLSTTEIYAPYDPAYLANTVATIDEFYLEVIGSG